MTQIEALELKFCNIWGFGTEIFVHLGSRTAKLVRICDFCWKGALKELKHAEKGVLRAAHPRTPFQGEYPPGFGTALSNYHHHMCTSRLRNVVCLIH